MNFERLAIDGAWQVTQQRHADDRGHFARVFCQDEFAQHGLTTTLSQMSVSFNHRAGTLRGMHLQRKPHGECKLVRATRGAIWDVLLDLRAQSPSFMRWAAVELSAEQGNAVYIPSGVAHGFLTLADGTEVLYAMDVPFHAESADGVRWNDPAFGIAWPLGGRVPVMSPRDAAYPDWDPARAGQFA